MTYQTFEKVMIKMQAYFGRKITDEIFEIYWERLQEVSDEQFQASAVKILSSFGPTSTKPFPLICDFLSACGEDGRTRAVNIVSAVKKAAESLGQYPSVDFKDRALHATIKRYGGWPDVVFWNEQDWQLHERNFIIAYEAAREANIGGPAYLPGVCEMDNLKNGFKNEEPVLVCSKTGNILRMPKSIAKIVEEHKAQLLLDLKKDGNTSGETKTYKALPPQKSIREIFNSPMKGLIGDALKGLGISPPK